MARDQVAKLLQGGIAAAKAKRKAEARTTFERVLVLDPQNISAWLWLSGLVEDVEEQERCLEQVVALDPNHAAARKGLAVVRPRVTERLLEQGITAAEAGQRQAGRALLLKVLERDEECVAAWWQLGQIADNAEERHICLDNVLTLDPEHAGALQELAALRAADLVPDGGFNPWAPGADDAGAPQYASLAGEVLGEEFIEQHSQASPEPEVVETATVSRWQRFDDVYLCPYCAAATAPEDEHCAACRNPLWVKVRRRESRSMTWWILFAFQGLNVIVTGLFPLFLTLGVALRLGTMDVGQVFPLYFGLPSDLPPEAAALALEMLPRGVFVLSWLPALFSSVVLLGLYFRWPFIFYLLLGNAGLGALLSVINFFALVGSPGVISGLLGLFFSAGYFFLIFQLRDEFAFDKHRLLFRLDRGLQSAQAYMVRGRQYAAQGMWALAAIHFRRAAGSFIHDTQGYVALAVACLKIREYELAEGALDAAQAINALDSQVVELRALLEERRAGEVS